MSGEIQFSNEHFHYLDLRYQLLDRIPLYQRVDEVLASATGIIFCSARNRRTCRDSATE